MNPICEVGVVYTPSLSQRLLFTLAIVSAMTVRTIIYKIINKLWSKLIEFSEPSKKFWTFRYNSFEASNIAKKRKNPPIATKSTVVIQ